MASDSIVSGASRETAIGAPRDSVTGKPIPEDPRIPTSPQQSPIGAETRIEPPKPPSDPTPEEIAAQISAEQPEAEEPAQKPTTLPRDHSGWISATASPNGDPVKKWSGNPEDEIMPGEDVLYWVRSTPQAAKGDWSWIVPMQAKILGRLTNGDYVGIRFRSIHGGVFAIQQTRASLVPKLDMITARKKFPPDLCMLPPGE